MKKQNCLNCGTEINTKYCSNCGQSANTHRINLSFLWHDIQHGLLHVDKGIFFTLRELFTRPGYSIQEFISGKRVQHFKPLSLIIVLAGVFGILSHYFDINILANKIEVTGTGEVADKLKNEVSNFGIWLSQHYSLFIFIEVPLFAVGTYFTFKSTGYNFIEHCVLHTFLAAQRLMLHILILPPLYIFHAENYLKPIERIIDVIGISLVFWSLMQFFKNISLVQRILKIAISLIVFFALMFSLLTGLSMIVLPTH